MPGVNRSVEGSAEPPADLVEEVARAIHRNEETHVAAARAAIAAVRAYDAAKRGLRGPVINVVMDPPRPVIVTEVYERRCDGTMRRIR